MIVLAATAAPAVDDASPAENCAVIVRPNCQVATNWTTAERRDNGWKTVGAVDDASRFWRSVAEIVFADNGTILLTAYCCTQPDEIPVICHYLIFSTRQDRVEEAICILMGT